MRFLFDARTTGPIQATLGGKASEDIASKALARIDQRIRITNDERRSMIDDLQFPYRALEDRNLRHRVARALEFFADLVFQVGGVADAIDQKIEEPLGREQTLRFELFDGFVAHGHVGAPEMEHDIIVAALTDAFEAKPLHDSPS